MTDEFMGFEQDAAKLHAGYVDDVVDLPRGTMVFGDVLVPEEVS
jgi:hypothetical protein